MEVSLENILTDRLSKEEMISFMNKHPFQFEKTINVALTDNQPQAWRAAWLLGHCMNKDDHRIQARIKAIIEAIGTKKDGHQRELLKILEKMNINEDHEGALFDVCMTIWESINKSPSVRIVAFRILAETAKKYPELNKEIEFFTQNHYTETLSPGILHSFVNIKKELK